MMTFSHLDLLFYAEVVPGRAFCSEKGKRFTAANSVVNGIHPIPNQFTGGEGAVTGVETLITITFNIRLQWQRERRLAGKDRGVITTLWRPLRLNQRRVDENHDL